MPNAKMQNSYFQDASLALKPVGGRATLRGWRAPVTLQEDHQRNKVLSPKAQRIHLQIMKSAPDSGAIAWPPSLVAMITPTGIQRRHSALDRK
jgi:hypothetical protein